MTPTQANDLHTSLQAQIRSNPECKGVQFGEVAYFTFLQKNWIVWKKETGILKPHLEYEATFYNDLRAVMNPALNDLDGRLV